MAVDLYRSTGLTRNQLAQFLKTPELIRAFEELQGDVTGILPANEAEITRLARMALALAAQALMLADSVQPEDPMLIPGPRGSDGMPGVTLALLAESESEEPPIRQAVPAAVPVTGSRATDAWRTSLMTALVSRGILIDGSTP